MVWPTIKQSENTEMFKSKLRYQAIFQLIASFVKALEDEIDIWGNLFCCAQWHCICITWFRLTKKNNYQYWNRSSVVQIRHGDFRLRISQDEEDIQSVLDWYNRLGFIDIKIRVRHFLSFGLVKQDGSNQFETPRQSPCFFRVDAVFLDHLSQDIRGTNSSAVWR